MQRMLDSFSASYAKVGAAARASGDVQAAADDRVTAALTREAAASRTAAESEVADADRVTAALLREAAAAKVAGDEQAAAALKARAAAGAPGQPGGSRVFIAGPVGQPNRSVVSGPAGKSTVSLDGGQYAGLISAIVESGQGPVLGLGAGGGGNGAGSGLLAAAAAGGAGRGGNGTLGNLLWGGGSRGRWTLGLPLAGAGSVAAFAGLGAEHLLFTGLGLAGSAGSALGGAGLLGLGAAGGMAVGGGSDLAVIHSTVADTQALAKSYANLSKAIGVYGKGSREATIAQAELNYQIKDLGNTVGVKAEERLAKNAAALDKAFDQKSGPQRAIVAGIGEQVLKVGDTFLPLMLQAAQKNLTIISSGIKPLFAWIDGPQGIGVWHQLEDEFSKNLPYAVHAFDQAIELILREMGIASQYTGGFTRHLDELLTRLNAKPDSTLQAWTQNLIGDFRLWEQLVKLLGEDIYLLFHQDVGTGNSIIESLNGMLERLHAYESSTHGSAQLQSIFMIHKAEILALLNLIGPLTSLVQLGLHGDRAATGGCDDDDPGRAKAGA